jgi:hypothetical protein
MPAERRRPAPARRDPGPVLAALAARAAAAIGVPAAALTARRRGDRRTVLARQTAIYLAVVELELGRKPAAAFFGRDRSTVGHSVRRIEDRRDDPAFDAWLEELAAEVLLTGRRGQSVTAPEMSRTPRSGSASRAYGRG